MGSSIKSPAAPATPAAGGPGPGYAQALDQAKQLQAQAKQMAQTTAQMNKQGQLLAAALQKTAPGSLDPNVAAQAQAFMGQADAFDKQSAQVNLAALQAEMTANKLSGGGKVPFALAKAVEDAQREVQAYGGKPEDISNFMQAVAQQLSALPDATSDDVGMVAGQVAAQFAQEKYDAVMKKFPPDSDTVSVKPGDAGTFEALKKKALSLVGPGDPKTVEKFLDKSKDSLNHLNKVAGMVAGSTPPEKHSDAPENLYAPLLSSLKTAYPSATFSLVVLDKAPKGKEPVEIQMALPGKDGQSRSFNLALDPKAVAGNKEASNKMKDAILADPELKKSFNDALGKVPGAMAQDTAEKSLDHVHSDKTRLEMMSAVLRMPPADQQKVLAALGPQKPGQLFGGLLERTDNTPFQQQLAAVDVSPIADGKPAAELQATINIGPANDAKKWSKMYEGNEEAMFAPQLLQAQMTGPTPVKTDDNSLEKFIFKAQEHDPKNVKEHKLSPENAKVKDQIKQVLTENKMTAARITTIPVMDMAEGVGPQFSSVYRIDTPKGPRFVDDVGRYYESFKDWENDNQLAPGKMTYPANGELKVGKDGKFATVTKNTPMTPDTLWKKTEDIVQKVGMPLSMGLGVASILAPWIGIPAMAMGALGMGMMVPFSFTAVKDLVDRHAHRQSINPLKTFNDPGVWDDYLMLASMWTGFAGGAAMVSYGTPLREMLKDGGGAKLLRSIIDPAGGRAVEQAMQKAHIEFTGWRKPFIPLMNNASALTGAGMVINFDREMFRDWDKLGDADKTSQAWQNALWSALTVVGMAPKSVMKWHNYVSTKAGGKRPGIDGYVAKKNANVAAFPSAVDLSQSTPALRNTQLEDAAKKSGVSPAHLADGMTVVGLPKVLYKQGGVEKAAPMTVSTEMPVFPDPSTGKAEVTGFTVQALLHNTRKVVNVRIDHPQIVDKPEITNLRADGNEAALEQHVATLNQEAGRQQP